ncbi:hypothetical protein NDN08_004542 [Rhodosorus marinus]|uniref:Uncharacterized protein n=1 Tax=Rhodosorus marinus TaxID=101924 RepID=A0AAV8ULX2_9RHOD|nr:hypothetical protein NDN08_004542 [Rhodosorus marinus]
MCNVSVKGKGKTRGILKIVEDETLNQFFVDDGKGGRRELDQKEKEYLVMDALHARTTRMYGAPRDLVVSDEQLDLLQEDLMWQGSRVLLLNAKETGYLEAARAYYRNEPIMSDHEFDELRQELVMEGSVVAVSDRPKCSVETRICSTDLAPDSKRMFAVHLPAAGVGAIVWAAISYGIPFLRNVSDLYSLLFGLPVVVLFSKVTTSMVIKDPSQILRGACPNCGEDIRAHFGSILTISGPQKTSQMKCDHCRAQLTFRAETRKVEINANNMTRA